MKLFNSKRISKKGDLSLSINAIVILILAITMLGLGLTFMRGLFKNITEKTNEALPSELTVLPTVDNPVILAPPDLTLRQGKREDITIAYMNIVTSASKSKCKLVSPFPQEPANNQVPKPPILVYSKAEEDVDKDQVKTNRIAISAPGDATTGVIIYTVQV